jgi:hypothetical protein
MCNCTLTGPQFPAKMKILSFSMQVVARFRTENLPVEKIYRVHGFDSSSDESVVYRFKLRSPEENVNIILDDRPLQGL